MANYGKLDRHRYPRLRHVFFAGEVFPIPQFRVLKSTGRRRGHQPLRADGDERLHLA